METDMDQGVGALRTDQVKSRAGLDRDERLVKDGILRMGSLVETQIRDAVQSVVLRDVGIAEKVILGDARINEAQREVADAIVMTIATQAPVARDLRFLMALDHVAYELERIGDHASSIAKQAHKLVEAPALREVSDLARMGNLAADLVGGIIAALIDVDELLARAVATRDDEIDHAYHELFARIVDRMRSDGETIERGTRLILAAHWIERIGDRVTNVAEDVVYLATGRIEDLN
jgi:phosphate transport system protein